MDPIRVAIAGVGNCASALVQGVAWYAARAEDRREGASGDGLMRSSIGGFRATDLRFVAAFDVDARKVGRSLEEAIFAAPNCARVFEPEIPATGVIVERGPVLDGVAAHMADHAPERAFRVADAPSVDLVDVLRAARAEVLVCYLPVGSERAVHRYAEACLEAGIAFVNCVPVFDASDPGRARERLAAYDEAGIDVVCLYPHGLDRPDYEAALAAITA